jgi:hypothetical protein
MRKRILLGALLIGSLLPTGASAWWDEGHMQIAAVAYERLQQDIRDKVDALLKHNPDYQAWVAGVPAEQAARHAFIRAASWADDIKKRKPDYIEDKPNNPAAGQNIGYPDKFMHDYWHYMDSGFSTDGTEVKPAEPVNALSQIKLLTAGLSPSSKLPDEVRSYDLVWLMHLVGDAHQPLHATSRFSHFMPDGDEGGNKDLVVPATGERIKLHAYWDRLLGGSSTPEGASWEALKNEDTKLPEPDKTLAADADPEHWFKESAKLAEQFAYAEPVRSCLSACLLDRSYETNARAVARKQAGLAGARLAALIARALQ